MNMDKLLGDRLFLVLSGWSYFKWPFSPGGVQDKQAIGTRKGQPRPLNRGDSLTEVETIVIIGVQISGLRQPTP